MAIETIVMDLTLRLVLNNGLDKNAKQFSRANNLNVLKQMRA